MLDVFFTLEANEQLEALELNDSNKILRAIRVFKTLPIQAKNSKNLGDGLFEIKADNTRAYYKYHKGKIYD